MCVCVCDALFVRAKSSLLASERLLSFELCVCVSMRERERWIEFVLLAASQVDLDQATFTLFSLSFALELAFDL